MPNCSISCCKNRSLKVNFKNNGTTYYMFPKNAKSKEIWIHATGRQNDWFPTRNSVICTDHFEEKCFQTSAIRRHLFPDAIPTLKLKSWTVYEPDHRCPRMDSMNTGNLVTTFRTARISQWEKLLQAHASFEPVHCMPATLGEPAGRPAEKFSTGSEYEGTWDELGMSGRGRYTFPNEVIYEGELFDGMFHGEGELQYPDGAVLRGRWRRGELLQRTLIFADGLAYKEEDWEYCTMPDRRFTVEYNEGLRPAGATFLTAKQPTPDIPPGCLDTADGFYDPVIKMVMRPDDIKQILRYEVAKLKLSAYDQKKLEKFKFSIFPLNILWFHLFNYAKKLSDHDV